MTTATIQTVRETINANFNFSVDKLPLYGPENLKTPHYGLFRSDNGECLPAAVKKGYEPHTVDDICALAEAAILSFDSAAQASVTCYWNKRGHNVIVQPSKEYRRAIFGTADNIFPRVIIHGYFGRAFTLHAGLYRDACKNLMIPQTVGTETFVSIHHTFALRDRMSQLISDCRACVEQFGSMVTLMQRLEDRRVAVADFMAELYPAPETDSKKALTQHKRRTKKILERLVAEAQRTGRKLGDDASLYQLVNAVTAYVQHDKSRHGEPDSVGRALLAVDDAEAKQAWQLAGAMLAA